VAAAGDSIVVDVVRTRSCMHSGHGAWSSDVRDVASGAGSVQPRPPMDGARAGVVRRTLKFLRPSVMRNFNSSCDGSSIQYTEHQAKQT